LLSIQAPRCRPELQRSEEQDVERWNGGGAGAHVGLVDEEPIRQPERGGSDWEPIKNFPEG
jgi:hypothetical protein